MKQPNRIKLSCELSTLKDNAKFRRTTRKGACVYTVQRDEKDFVIFTSKRSKRTFIMYGTTLVYPV